VDRDREDQQRDRLVKRRHRPSREEDEAEGDEDPGQGVAGVGEPLDQPRHLRRVADRQRGHDERRDRPDRRGPGRDQQRVAAQRGDRLERGAAGRDPLRGPVDQHSDREDEGDQDDQRAKGQRRPAPAPEPVGLGRPQRPRPQPVDRFRPPHPRGGQQQPQHRDDEDGAEGRGGDPVEARLVSDVDLGGEGVEAEDRDGAEVADDEQRDQQRAGGDHRPQLRQHHGAEDFQRPAPHRPRRVLELRIDPPQRRPQRDQEQGEGEQRQHQPGAEEAVDRGQPLDPERVLQHPVRPQRGDQQVGADVARDHQRQRAEDRPEPPPRQVGADRQPADRQGYRDRCEDDGRGQRRGPQQRFQRPRGERDFQRGDPVAGNDDDEVGGGEDGGGPDQRPRGEQPGRRPARRRHQLSERGAPT
jgi:hypothetical protein